MRTRTIGMAFMLALVIAAFSGCAKNPVAPSKVQSTPPATTSGTATPEPTDPEIILHTR